MYTIEQVLADYHLEAIDIKKLEGYDSNNYRISTTNGVILIKHYDDLSTYKIVEAESNMINSLRHANCPIQFPHSLQELKIHEDNSFSRCMTYIEGKLLSEVNQSNQLLQEFGKYTAMMNLHLLGMDQEDAIKAREQCWDLKHAMLNLHKVLAITNPSDRKYVDYYFDKFQQEVLPIQSTLRQSIIHSDLNDNNVIVADNQIKGFIDFGDIAHSPLIYEVAIALTYIMLANPDQPFAKAAVFLESYHAELPLMEQEIELLSILIPTRLSVSVTNSAIKKMEGQDSDYILISEQPAWNLLRKWIEINPIWITNYFAKAIGISTSTMRAQPLLQDRARYLGASLSTSYTEPIFMTGAAFQYMYDNLGNAYLDAYNNIKHVGHCHPRISKAISKQTRTLNTNTRYLYPQITDYAKSLLDTLPDNLQKVFFVNSGSEGTDLAIRVARTYTGRQGIAILEHGYHGKTNTGIEISHYKHSGKGGQGSPDYITTLPLPNALAGMTGEAFANNAIEILQRSIDSDYPPAALIVECISGCGGQVPLAPGYLSKLKPFLQQHDILLIADEVQIGFGRLGKWFWGFEMQEIEPDIVVMGKPIANGHPMSAVAMRTDISDRFANGMEFFSSFGGNPVSCTIANTVLSIIEEEGLQEHALQVGTSILDALADLAKDYPMIKDVRGAGLFIGVELSGEDEGTVAAKYLKEYLKSQFILVSIDGPLNNVIKIKPPLCFTRENADLLVSKFKDGLISYDELI